MRTKSLLASLRTCTIRSLTLTSQRLRVLRVQASGSSLAPSTRSRQLRNSLTCGQEKANTKLNLDY